MKELEELALGPSDVAVITPKVISKTIEEIARAKTVFSQFYRKNRDLVGDHTPDEISFPKQASGIITAWNVPPGSSIAASNMTYEATTIRVSKGGIRIEFVNEALRSAMRDVIKDHIKEAGLQWAEQLDVVARDVMLDVNTASATLSTGSTLTVGSSYKPILEIKSVNGNAIDSVDYYKGIIYFASGTIPSTVTFTYAKRPNSNDMVVEVRSASTISAWDMLQTKNKLVSKNRNPDIFLIHPSDLPGLLYDQNLKFLDVSAYGSTEAVLNGEIGKVFGMKVFSSTRVPEGVGIALDSNRLGYDVIKKDLTGYREDKYEFDSVWYHFWGLRGYGVTDDLAVAIVVGGKTGQYKAVKS